MVTQKTCRSLITYLFACIVAVFITGCSSGSNDQTIAPTTSPLAANYNELTAIPGPMAAVRVGEVATLDGSTSSITSNEPLSYNWSFSYKPAASNAVLQGATTATPSFTADVRGVYMLELVVSAKGVSSQRTIATVVATIDPERLTGPFNHLGLSSNCGDCHNGVNKVGNGKFIPPKVPDHVATSNMCQACHTPQGYNIIPFVDHQEVFGNCSECHDGVTAIGKSEFHAPTNAECSDCHNTRHFLELNPDGSFDHSSIVRSCSGCHNGTVAIGKTDTVIHQNTTSECGSCHSTVSFLGGYPDHTGPEVVGAGITCNSCHVANGSGAAKGQSLGHPDTTATGVDCVSCHSIVSFKMPGGIFNHSLLDASVQSCESCHNDNTSINAPAKSSAVPTHPTTNVDCGSCHNTESFTPAFDYNHDGVVANCQTCHGNNSPVPPQVTATGKPLATLFYAHMPTNPDNPGTASDQDCGDCHTPGTFTTGTYDHADAAAGSCTSCHDNRISVGKLLNHIPTTPDNQECDVCHNTTTFTAVTFDHASTDTSNCLTCHNGSISTGKSLSHVATNLNCSSCHITPTFNTFVGTFAHDLSIVGGDCASCHNTGIATPKKVNHIPAQAECSQCHNDTTIGGFTSASTFIGSVHPGITGGCEGCHISKFIPDNPLAVKAVSHLPTVQDCDVCHTNVSFMAPTNFTHEGITSNCESCHDGSASNVAAGALGKAQAPDPHPATTSDCGSCHAIGNNFTDGTFDHTGIVANCSACHGDNPTSAPVGPMKNIGHVPTSQDCSFCHVPGTFKPAVFDHTGIVNNCVSCHNGTDATGMPQVPQLHPDTLGKDCSACHNTTAFAGAKYDHTGIVDGCASCHDGATARGKIPPPDHVPTNDDCSVCHQTTGFIPGTFDHAGIVENCRSCHNGKFAIGKTDTHVQTNQDCGICHTASPPLSFKGAVFDHTGIVDNCVSCHDGGTAIGMDAKTNPAHIATALDCHFCHTTATFLGGSWVHDASTTNNCDQCHVDGGAAKTFKPLGHLSTTFQCDACHTTNGWAPTSFSHTSPNYPGDHRIDPGCSGCHGNTVDNTLPYPHPQYAPPQRNAVYCAACHAGDFDRKGDHIGGENGTVEQNKNCAGSGCHRVSDSNFD